MKKRNTDEINESDFSSTEQFVDVAGDFVIFQSELTRLSKMDTNKINEALSQIDNTILLLALYGLDSELVNKLRPAFSAEGFQLLTSDLSNMAEPQLEDRLAAIRKILGMKLW